ncbi:MAG: hypothetical protein AB7V18_12455 [Pyrinomonadaceae bacterium]
MFKKASFRLFRASIFAAVIAASLHQAIAQTGEIVGSWKNGSVGMIQYENRVTGATKPGRGSIFTYKFLPNGNYEFVGYMETTMYNCTTTLFNQINGKYTVDGSTVYLNPAKDHWRSTNSCAASGNKQQNKVPTKKTLEFDIRNDDYGKQLLCLNDGNGETCYRKEEQ